MIIHLYILDMIIMDIYEHQLKKKKYNPRITIDTPLEKFQDIMANLKLKPPKALEHNVSENLVDIDLIDIWIDGKCSRDTYAKCKVYIVLLYRDQKYCNLL